MGTELSSSVCKSSLGRSHASTKCDFGAYELPRSGNTLVNHLKAFGRTIPACTGKLYARRETKKKKKKKKKSAGRM
jgi:hypothetical protein